MNLSGSDPDVNFELAFGYYDDFSTDHGWTVTGSATAGEWERGIPVQTTFDGVVSNPGDDVVGDCGFEGGSLRWYGRAALARGLPGPLRLPQQGSCRGNLLRPSALCGLGLWCCTDCLVASSPPFCPAKCGFGLWL